MKVVTEGRGQTARMINGAEAMAIGFELAGVRIAYTYPITPQVEVMETFSRSNRIVTIQGDSEYSVLAGAQGVVWAGERCAVATASQGLVLMSEVLWEVAGNRLPIVMGVFNRALKGPGWCLGAQQNDTLFMRDTGWLQFYCETAQEMLDLILIGFRVAEEICLPVIVAGDGFYLSHETEEVLIPDEREAAAFVGERMRCEAPMPDPHADYGGLMPAGKYFRAYRRMHHDVRRAASVFDSAAAEFAGRFGRRYGLASPLYTEDAETVVVSAGTICGTIREVVEQRRDAGERIGMVKLHAFRPFPADALVDACKGARRVVVVDRNLAPGLGGIFASEVRAALGAYPPAPFPASGPAPAPGRGSKATEDAYPPAPFPASGPAPAPGRGSKATEDAYPPAPFPAAGPAPAPGRGSKATLYSFVTGLGGSDVTPEMIGSALDYAAGHADPPDTLFLFDTGVEF